jgi:hypothetical protein
MPRRYLPEGAQSRDTSSALSFQALSLLANSDRAWNESVTKV